MSREGRGSLSAESGAGLFCPASAGRLQDEHTATVAVAVAMTVERHWSQKVHEEGRDQQRKVQ